MLPLLKINRYATQVFSIRLLGSRSVICKSGKILVQGQGVFGAIGSGDLKDAATFRPLALDRTSESEKNSMISAGWGHSAAVDDTGRLFIFGRPFDFPNLMRIDKIYKVSKWLARMVASSSNKFFGDVMGFYPSPTCFPSSSNVVDLSVSAGLTAFLTADGSVYCFGLNRWGQCGVEMEANMHQYTPLQVPGLPPCAKVEAGLQHCIALSRDGHVYTWGKANKGQLGTVTAKEAKDLPLSCPATQVMLGGAASPKFQSNATTSTASAKLKAIDISAGFAHSAAVTEDGAVYVWGRHMSAQLMNKDYGTG